MARSWSWFTMIIVALLASFATPEQAKAASSLKQSDCSDLNDADFSGVTDAPTQIIQIKYVPSANGLPAYCYVKGYVASNINFELELPLENWNGKFVEVGCGGFCGVSLDGYVEPGHDCDLLLRRGYVCIASDLGHRSTIPDAKWAYNNKDAIFDFAIRGAHVVALSGKAIAQKLYGKTPQRSYFWGCSTGGRQGLVAAQNFPEDFDGILAGAPALNLSARFVAMLWNDRSMKDQSGNPLIGSTEARFIQAAAIAECDMNDGVKDGLIGDPRSCRFDPKRLACDKTKAAGCLSPSQVAAVQKVLSGPTNAQGTPLYAGGLSPEVNLDELNQMRRGGQTRPQYFSGEFFRYMGFMPAPGPAWRNDEFDFDRDVRRLGLVEAQLASTNPDLRRFKANGGKLIVYQGWSDVPISPFPTIDYYETVTRTMGGIKVTQDFMRLFMVPGMEHCIGGPGAVQVDYLTALENWVEKGEAPQMLVGSHVKDETEADWIFPLDPERIKFTRPIYPYPARVRYSGHGDPAKYTSFEPESTP
ncbi:MAG TPA: tannase/feruloyl esterase family alpha/beta hydrolase [Burkholderiales bacterium]